MSRAAAPSATLTEAEERISVKPVKSASARSTGLALALDDGTRKSHSMAENTQFVTGFFKGISTRSAFAQLVASLYFVYQAMEKAFNDAQDPNVRAMDFSELRRLPSLEQDMAYYYGENWQQTVKPNQATKEYCNRVATIARDEPLLLIAHMYTRYLGDLFGGQMMGGMARTSLNLDDSLGTKFYEFDDIDNNKQFIEEWYTKLNQLDLTDEEKRDIVDEANLVFALNIKLFNELSTRKRDAISAVWRLVMDAAKAKLR
jgi:heme oxygenase